MVSLAMAFVVDDEFWVMVTFWELEFSHPKMRRIDVNRATNFMVYILNLRNPKANETVGSLFERKVIKSLDAMPHS